MYAHIIANVGGVYYLYEGDMQIYLRTLAACQMPIMLGFEIVTPESQTHFSSITLGRFEIWNFVSQSMCLPMN